MVKPLAERLRPKTLDEYIGQKHLVGRNAVLRNMIESGRTVSFILWGPPGVGKTTLALIVANQLHVPFYTLSAVSSGGKEVREVIEKAKHSGFFNSNAPILFIDEIHRFSKSQQDSLLAAVEQGVVTLIGATTENPSFEVIRPLLSRCQLYVLKPLEKEDLLELLHRAVTEDIGLANPNALLLANAAFDAVSKIGWPEGRIPLAEATVYLATSAKSNSAYNGIAEALSLVKKTGNLPVPLHLRNAPTKLMADLGYHDGYKYAHDYPDNFVVQQYLPDGVKDERIWHAQHSPAEEKMYQRMLKCWGDRFSR